MALLVASARCAINLLIVAINLFRYMAWGTAAAIPHGVRWCCVLVSWMPGGISVCCGVVFLPVAILTDGTVDLLMSILSTPWAAYVDRLRLHFAVTVTVGLTAGALNY